MKMPEGFECEDSIRPYLEKVFKGEYDVPYWPEKPPVILDIGANVGAFSLWALDRWPGALIHAYEPHPETFKTLCKNVAGTRVIPYNYGIASKEGWFPLYDGLDNSGEASLFDSAFARKGTGIHVEIKTPDVLPEADILKMDTEGCEVQILDPLITSGRKFAAVMFEYHSPNDRRDLDLLLVEYVLAKAHVTPFCMIGTMNYIHPDHIQDYFKICGG